MNKNIAPTNHNAPEKIHAVSPKDTAKQAQDPAINKPGIDARTGRPHAVEVEPVKQP